MKDDNPEKNKESDITKQNQDFPNVPAASEKIRKEETLKKEVKDSSELHSDGKTDNTEKNSEN